MPHALAVSIVGVVASTLVTGAGVTVPSTPREGLLSLRTGVARIAVQPGVESGVKPGAPAARSERGGVQTRTRIVYVSVTDKKGSPITDLKSEEFEVKAGGKVQQVVSVRPASAPLRVAILVADGGTGFFQRSLAYFMEKLLGSAEFAVTSVVVQAEKVVDYSSDAGALSAGLRRMGTRRREGGAQLMEAIQDATKEVRVEPKEVPAEAKRPVIVVMRVGGEGPTPLSGNDVREQLRRSGAILYVISTVGAQRAAPSQARPGISGEQAQLHDAELAEGAFNLAQVLGDGSRESGGRHDEVVATTLVPALERVADELLHQYEVTYVLPDSVKPGAKLEVSSKRKGVTVRAPSRLPN